MIKDLNEFIEISDEEAQEIGIDVNLLPDTEKEKNEDTSKSKKETSNDPYKNEEELEIKDDELETESNEVKEEEVTEKNKSKGKPFFTNDSNNESSEADNLFGEFSNELRDGGLFPNLEDEDFEEIESIDDLGQLINKQNTTSVMTWKNEYVQNLIGNLVKDGFITPDQARSQIVKEYREEDFEDETIAIQVIKEYHRVKEIPKSMSDRILKNSLDLKESAMEASSELKVFKKKQETDLAERIKQQDEHSAKEKERFDATLRNEVNAYDEFIPGRKLTTRDKEKVYKSIPTVMDKINKNTAHYMPILAYLDSNGMLDGNFKKILAEGETKSTNKMSSILKNRKKKTSDDITRKEESPSFEIDDSDLNKRYR